MTDASGNPPPAAVGTRGANTGGTAGGGSVSVPTPLDKAWQDLAGELAPAKSLTRLDAATSRVLSSVSLIATLLTGLGLVTAGLPIPRASRAAAIAAVVVAFLAVLAAVAAQVVTVTRELNTNNLAEVKTWYRRRVRYRAPLAIAATILLVLAVAAAATAALITLASRQIQPSLTITRTLEYLESPTPPTTTSGSTPGTQLPPAAATVVVEATFRRLTDGQSLRLAVLVDGEPAAQAVVAPALDGTATRTLTLTHVPASASITAQADGGGAICTAQASPAGRTTTHCR